MPAPYDPNTHCGAHPDHPRGPCRARKGTGTPHPGHGPCHHHDPDITPQPAVNTRSQVNDSTDIPRARTHRGRFMRSIQTAERDAEAARLRSRSMSYRQIAAALGIDVAAAHAAVQRALHDTLAEPAGDVRALELEKLDRAERAVLAVLERRHLTVSHGKVISVGGEPLEDDAPVLAAADRLVRISESRRKLLGLDSPVKVNLSGGVKYEVVGVDAADLA